MGKLLSLLIVLSISLSSVHAQEQDSFADRKNEIGINLFSLTNYENSFLSYEKSIETHFVSGIRYKRYFGQNALRVGFDYYHSNYTDITDIRYFMEGGELPAGKTAWEGDISTVTFRIGYERKLNPSKLQPYIAADIVLSYKLDKGEYESIYVGALKDKFSYSSRTTRIGVSPAVGLEYYFCDRFSASMETNLNIMLISFHEPISGYEHSQNIGDQLDIIFNPLSLFSVDYHF